MSYSSKSDFNNVNEERKYKIVIYNEFFIIAQALELFVKDNFPLNNVYKVDSKLQLIEECLNNTVDLAIVDIKNDNTDDYSIIKGIRRNSPNVKILVFSYFNLRKTEDLCLRYGASSVLNINVSPEKIIATMKLILFGGDYFQNEIKIKLETINVFKGHRFLSGEVSLLSKRELEVAMMFVNGDNNLMVCKKLNLAMSTVSTIKKRIYIKTGVSNMIDLAKLFKHSFAS